MPPAPSTRPPARGDGRADSSRDINDGVVPFDPPGPATLTPDTEGALVEHRARCRVAAFDDTTGARAEMELRDARINCDRVTGLVHGELGRPPGVSDADPLCSSVSGSPVTPAGLSTWVSTRSHRSDPSGQRSAAASCRGSVVASGPRSRHPPRSLTAPRGIGTPPVTGSRWKARSAREVDVTRSGMDRSVAVTGSVSKEPSNDMPDHVRAQKIGDPERQTLPHVCEHVEA